MIEVYVKGNEDYESNGDMTLTPTTCEVELTVEGIAELTLEHPIDDLGRWEYLVNDNVIAAPTPYSKKQLFRIYDYTKTETEVTAYARHIFYDSAGEMLVDVRPTDKTGQEALDIILSGTKYKAKTNIKTRSTAYYIRKNIMEAIGGDDENSFINRWGGERMYDNFTVIINDRLGGDYGACAEFGRNMTGIEADISIDDVITRIIPVSYNGHTLEGEEPWIDSPLIGSYANPRAAVIKFEDVKLLEDCQEGEEGFSTLELLREELKRRCTKEYENGLDKPKVNYKVDLVEVANTEDYKDYKKLTTIGIGDDVLTKDRKLTDVFIYIIPTAGGVFAAAVVWYLKAVQLENGIKIQLGMIKKLIELGEENQAEETKERVIQKMKDKTDTIIDEALEPTEIQNF